MTLYMFTPDDGQAAPTCATGCLDKWPALISDSPTAGAGLDASKLRTVARADGLGKQVKYGDYFLYHFANDKAAGDINGQGVGTGKWYVVGADGEPDQAVTPGRSHRDRSLDGGFPWGEPAVAPCPGPPRDRVRTWQSGRSHVGLSRSSPPSARCGACPSPAGTRRRGRKR